MHTSSTPERRRFFARVIATIHAGIGGTLAVILGGAIFSPSFTRRRENWLKAALLGDLAESEPTPVTIRLARDDGYTQIIDRKVVFLVKTGESKVTAFSSTCTHLGCRVSWNAGAKEIQCPCHGGVFDTNGAVKSGPPPAPLARLAARVDGDQVLVQL